MPQNLRDSAVNRTWTRLSMPETSNYCLLLRGERSNLSVAYKYADTVGSTETSGTVDVVVVTI